ncbi:MAG: hypothetical protein M1508_03720 [Nitrospirae bacterium]|nr:hypothetical protein [Nitrospirota bacterium]MCL5423125.1 hypothetical protein [Nitrospirota bacterium]
MLDGALHEFAQRAIGEGPWRTANETQVDITGPKAGYWNDTWVKKGQRRFLNVTDKKFIGT